MRREKFESRLRALLPEASETAAKMGLEMG